MMGLTHHFHMNMVDCGGKKHFGMLRALSHWLTLSRIIGNHRRAAHGCCGIPKWGEEWSPGFLGATSVR